MDAPYPWSIHNYRYAGRFPLNSAIGEQTAASSALATTAVRKEALSRAGDFAPFLREAAATLPHIVEIFTEKGSLKAIEAALEAQADDV